MFKADQLILKMQFTFAMPTTTIQSMNQVIPCVLMRAGTSRGPFFLREWLPADDVARDEALIGAIGASDLLQVDGVGGGSTLTSKVAIVSKSKEPGCDVDYLFAQVGVGQRSVDTRPNCGNMLSGVAPFAIEQGLVRAQDGETVVRVFNVNTRSRIDVTVQTPGGRVTYEGETGIDGVAGTAAPVRLNFLDAWGAVTGSLFPTGRRIDTFGGLAVTCIDAAMPLVILRASELGLTGRETPAVLDADRALLDRIESIRLAAGAAMGMGDVSGSVVPKPVIASEGDDADSVTSRYFTPRRCHASHAVTGAIGVATAFALPGTVISGASHRGGTRGISVLHPQGRIDVEVTVEGTGDGASVQRAALVRTARKILQGDLHIPSYVYSRHVEGDRPMKRLIAPAVAAAVLAAASPLAMAFPDKTITIVVPTAAGGGNDAMARTIAQRLGALLGQTVIVDNRAGANGAIACEYVARATPDGHTLVFGYIGTHAMNPALQKLRYDPVADFAPIGLVGYSPTLMVANNTVPVKDVKDLVAQLKARPDKYTYASAGNGTAPHYAAELFKLSTGVVMLGAPYKGAAPAISDTIGGQTQFMFPSLFTALPHVKSGKLRAFAIAGPARSPLLPDVPTLKEAGVSGVEVQQWYGFFAPAKTPKAVVDQLNKALNQVLAERDIVKRMEDHGATVETSTPEQFGAMVKGEIVKWKGVVQQAKLTVE
jgi:2-methylaconitate cis-trans-isomerase PrpF/tripartite-type tricarboxylate transporter receptor subunit TctC